MGVGITGISKAKLVPCQNDEDSDPECIEEHLTIYTPGRRKDAVKMGEGVTSICNRFHDSDEAAADIQRLRDLHVEMDQAVAAYGWSDLDLGHGFHETKQGLRFTISEPARREVLTRLLKLNHKRYAEEVEQGLHDKKAKARPKKASGERQLPVYHADHADPDDKEDISNP